MPFRLKTIRKLTQIWPYLVKIGHNLPQKFSILVHPEQSEVIIHGANCLFGPATITRYQNIKKQLIAKLAKIGSNFTLIRPQKTNFAQIEHLFSLRYCLYEQAGSFLGSFIQSRPSQDTLGKYFFQLNPEKVANRVIICSDFGSNAYFELYS